MRRAATIGVPALLAGLVAFILYARTLAPGLTWVHDGSDGGDLLAAALTRGVPHPSGYPTYQLLLRGAFALYPGAPARAGNAADAVDVTGDPAALPMAANIAPPGTLVATSTESVPTSAAAP